MAIGITHSTVVVVADDGTSPVGTDEWNADHALTGLGTGVETALGVNVGAAGAVVVNGGALGTPSSGTLTSATGLPIDAGTSGTLPVSRGGTGQTTEAEAVGELIQALTADATPDNAADYVATYDASADTGKKVLLSTIIRERLGAARTYYVRTDGSDSNTGLVDSAGGAFLTLQKAYDVIVATLDLGGFAVEVVVADGTYAGGVDFLEPWTGGGSVTYTGDTVTPANTDVGAFYVSAVLPALLTIRGFKTAQVAVDGAANVATSDMAMKASDYHFYADVPGARLTISGAIGILGNAANHYLAQNGGVIFTEAATTLTGTPAFSSAFAFAEMVGSIVTSATFAGSGTGKRYNADTNGVINTYGSGATYFPGNVAGTTDGYGVYV